MIFGPHPLDGENVRIYYGRMMDDIKAKIVDELGRMRGGELNDPDCGFIGYIFALNHLATEDRAIHNLAIYTDQVAEWQDAYLQWLDGVESQIPKGYRAAFREMVIGQFKELKRKSAPVPRDMW
nr:hypothetical protein [Micromonospora sp. DSM 115978]